MKREARHARARHPSNFVLKPVSAQTHINSSSNLDSRIDHKYNHCSRYHSLPYSTSIFRAQAISQHSSHHTNNTNHTRNSHTRLPRRITLARRRRQNLTRRTINSANLARYSRLHGMRHALGIPGLRRQLLERIARLGDGGLGAGRRGRVDGALGRGPRRAVVPGRLHAVEGGCQCRGHRGCDFGGAGGVEFRDDGCALWGIAC